ncbi:MAG TPA: MFS transporter [Rhizomicrobium sp.]|nr:MFS transporter [Rhizomicrobium sp.]
MTLSPPNAVLAILCAMYFLFFLNRTNLAIAGPGVQAELGLSNTDLGLVFAAFGIPYALLQPLGGAVGDKFGPRKTLAVCALTVCIATAWVGAAAGVVSLFLARLLLGIGEGAGFPTATRAMTAWTPKRRWGFAQGITHTFSRIGNAATSLIVAGLIAIFAWRAAFFLLVPITLAWAVLWFWYFRDDPATHPSMTPEVLAQLAPRGRGAAKTAIPWLALGRRMAPVTLVDFCYGWFLVVFQTWIPNFFVQNYGLNLSKTALFSTAVLFAGVIGDTVGGILTDVILHRTGNILLARRGVIVPGFLGACLFMIPVVFTRDLMAATICLSLAFFFAELIVAPIWALSMDIAPGYAGTASGMMNFGFGLASIVSPIFFGYTIERTQNWTVALSVSIAILLLGALLACYLRPDKPFIAPEKG